MKTIKQSKNNSFKYSFNSVVDHYLLMDLLYMQNQATHQSSLGLTMPIITNGHNYQLYIRSQATRADGKTAISADQKAAVFNLS